MPGTAHDPYAVFRFALRERDWVLADLIAKALVARDGSLDVSHARLVEELRSRAGHTDGAPRTLGALRIWATLAREVEQREDGEEDEEGEGR